jgi:AraC-like DNA-binding protein
MPFSYTTTFSLIEWLAVTGFVQCLLILVYIIFRAKKWRQAALAIGYFFLMAAAFILQFALRIDTFNAPLHLALWLTWMSGPSLCYLLVIQIAEKSDLPQPRHFLVLTLIPLAAAGAFFAHHLFNLCEGKDFLCARLFDWLYWLGSMAGAISLLALWRSARIFNAFSQARGGRERYWLALTLVTVNVLVVATGMMRAFGSLGEENTDALLTTFGLAFVYLVTTALFRVYPPPVQLNAVPRGITPPLSLEELALADQVRKLMQEDKLYQEPAFSRADLARELKVSESTLSKVINISFGKSFPQLLNELRVEDAKTMLRNSTFSVQVIASESGFNSLASFNRVFRHLTGDTPSSYRASAQENPL